MAFSGMRTQNATIWQRTGVDVYGDPTWSNPEGILVRIEKKTELVTDSSGVQRQGKSVIWVDRKLEEGDMIALGGSGISDPTSLSFSKEIISFIVTPSLSGNRHEYRAIVA